MLMVPLSYLMSLNYFNFILALLLLEGAIFSSIPRLVLLFWRSLSSRSIVLKFLLRDSADMFMGVSLCWLYRWFLLVSRIALLLNISFSVSSGSFLRLKV